MDVLTSATAVADELMGIPSFDMPDFSSPLSQELDLIGKLKKVSMVAGSAVKKFGTELNDHQQLLQAVSDILIQIYMAESTVLRTLKNIDRDGIEKQKTQIAISEYYTYQAIEIISNKGKEAIHFIAEGDEMKGMLMGLKRFTKYHQHPNIIALRNIIADATETDNGYKLD